MGLAVEEKYGARTASTSGCKVYVGNSPDLLVLEDTDGDDKADKRYPAAHRVRRGRLRPRRPRDGARRWTASSTSPTATAAAPTSKITRTRHQEFRRPRQVGPARLQSDQLANTLRVNRDGTQFEILADRQRNNYETSLNSFGNIFTSDNDDDGNRGCRVIHVMDGGHYGYRTARAAHGTGARTFRGTCPSSSAPATAARAGSWFTKAIICPRNTRRRARGRGRHPADQFAFPLTRHGATFRTEAKVLLASDDPWFRPVDMTAAPDGSVFVADWYDAGVGGHAFRDQTTGRIYRVTTNGTRRSRRKGRLRHRPRPDRPRLKSPVVASQDAERWQRRGLIEHGESSNRQTGGRDRARQPVHVEPAARASPGALGAPRRRGRPGGRRRPEDTPDPTIREQAVRILGRDDRDERTASTYTKGVPPPSSPRPLRSTSPRSCRWRPTPTPVSDAS